MHRLPSLVALLTALALSLLAVGCDKSEEKDDAPSEGEQAIEAVGELTEKACACNADEACIEAAKKDATAWGEKYADTRGGDQEKAEAYAMELATCAPSVAMALVEATE